MRYSVAALISSACLVIQGCGSAATVNHQVNSQVVKVSDITAVVKCGLAQALKYDATSKYPRFAGRIALVKYTFKLVDTSTVSANLKTTAPVVFALGAGGGSITPKLSASYQQQNTVQTTINSRIGLSYEGTEVCDSVSTKSRTNFPFEKWLAAMVSQLDAHASQSPYGVVDKLQLETEFGVLTTGSAGAELQFVMLGFDPSLNISRNDVQSMSITLQAPTKEASYPVVFIDGVRKGPSTQSSPKNPVNKKPPVPPKTPPTCQSDEGIGCLEKPYPTE